MNEPNILSEERGVGSLEHMIRVIRDLLDHPFPNDLMKLRHRVESEYGGDDSAAKAEMEEWCSQELCDRELDAYLEARKAGNAIIKEYDHTNTSKETENHSIDAFLAEVHAVCKKHKLSLSHEDGHGAFKVEDYDESNIEWLMTAHDATEPNDGIQRPGTPDVSLATETRKPGSLK